MYKEILRCPLAGTIPDNLKLCCGMKVGSPVRAFYNPKNMAIRLYYFNVLLGYVPTTSDEALLYKYKQEGHKIWCYITEYNRDHPPRFPLYIGFKVKINDEETTPASEDIPL